jgi:hypothetical protein
MNEGGILVPRDTPAPATATPAATPIKFDQIPCCPNLSTAPVCDVLDMHRRLTFPTTKLTERGGGVAVEVVLHTRFTRCSGPLALGDIVYSTTLLPGEKVRLATTDRRSRFSFDSESNLSYRSEQLSEEQYRMSALRAVMSDQNSTDNGSTRNADSGSWDFHGDASGGIGFFSASADANAHGSHNAQSTSDYLRQHRAHAALADNMSVEATRKAHSLSIGEVSSRQHAQGESEDHFESSSREFANPNMCHAVTFLFYRVNKTETIKFELVSIERRVLDPMAPTPLLGLPIRSIGNIGSVPQEVPATAKSRLEAEARGLESVAHYSHAATPGSNVVTPAARPLPSAVRQAALAEVDAELIAESLIDEATGLVSDKAKQDVGFEKTTSLPTAGVIVKGCLDDCSVCEPELQRKMTLELDRFELQNELVKRQIELLDKSQEYRCCPPAQEEGEK